MNTHTLRAEIKSKATQEQLSMCTRRQMMSAGLGVSIAAGCCWPGASLPRLQADEFNLGEIETLIAGAITAGDLPGAVVSCAGRGQIHYRQTFGHRWLSPDLTRLTDDTVFDLASITKSVATATSVALLYQDGNIDPKATVKHYLPEFKGRGKDAITVEQCLLHTSGLTPDNALADYLSGSELAWENICGLGLRSEPGIKFSYSDVGFIVLGKLVERISGTTIDRFASERIFQPLQMPDTGFNPPAALKPRIAPTENDDDGWVWGRVHDPRAHAMGGVAGHAGLFSTADDLTKFGQALLAASRGESDWMKESTLRWMSHPHPVPASEPRGTRALGWDHRSPYSRNRGQAFSEQAFGHGGFTGTVLWIDPTKELVFVWLSSRLYPDGKGTVNALAGNVATILGKQFG
ncbi:serine hydrolase domain-containing protein [Roseiconus lacunae]|uniref:serine hydrolase domain-containing protein n=1 Tax=Roseiconus lacunae TaxID=2605694 RepID=UPI0030924A80|nr:serine hydrolase domain-containing protein [Stieleria sp. HD01]